MPDWVPGEKTYGSIPHLPGSRTGPADRTVPEGQARICLERARDGRDEIIVTEKLDGSCVAIARVSDEVLALGREGRRAADSPNRARRMFAAWVGARADRFRDALEPGQRICGEWLALAHSTRYELEGDPFAAFDLMAGRLERRPYDELLEVAAAAGLGCVGLISRGPPLSIAAAIERLGDRGFHGALDLPEGAVWRVERRKRHHVAVDLVAKYVRPDKVDGALLPENTGEPAIYNWTGESA